ncbi:hypothetical protein CAPTEDRAFT_169825 [Capitella teleta]|uniref:Ionotropic glutamate receptor C-terminal domain-containing protein n=1 Tax=Capitella teleta TaxID=283909 RepID=R7U2R0_CAPTE|nr:hypothetical protein CAPTEDRAFT_169825 [Capitella teleta]|eukprot:ELU00163.1 hypothetical protein CAPTEDRAFT_169825 [Capitella teleta]
MKENYRYLQGNDKYEGFCMDLLKEIAEMLGFEYEVYVVPDGEYGDKKPDGTWSGVIGEILNAEASMAVAPLTINSERETVIDFSKPYKTFGISMVMKKPETEDSFFQFLDPLSPTVWLLLAGVLVLVSLTFCMMDKVAPADDPSVRFDAIESTWFTFASMVVSGTDVIPRTISGRLLAASLWFFSLIIISSYTANLAAFLTVSKFHSNIKSVTDLLDQSEVSYGTVTHSEVANFFENSKLHQFQQMWQIMSTLRSGGMAKNAAQGFAKVDADKNYAFLFDAPVIQHKVFTDCNVLEVGKPFDARSYGIAVPRGARYRDDLSMAILKLGELGRIAQLEEKWWDETKCPPVNKPVPNKTRSLTIHKVGGVFVILAVGIAVSLAAGVMDYYYRTRRKRIKAKKRDIAENHDSGDGHLQAHGKLLHDASPSVHFEEAFASNSTTNPGSKHTNIF